MALSLVNDIRLQRAGDVTSDDVTDGHKHFHLLTD